MKKLLLLLVAPCIMFSTLSAQITQQEADEIVKQRLDGEGKPCIVYAKETVQTEGFTVITATGETFALEYPCWVYYVDYAGETNGKYLIVKESSGNLLEVKTKKDTGPGDLTEWREVTFETEPPIEIPFEEYSLAETLCLWTNVTYGDYSSILIMINSNGELEQYISCAAGNYPEIDFSKYTLLLVKGISHTPIANIGKVFSQLSTEEYKLDIELLSYNYPPGDIAESWLTAIITNKLSEDCNIVLNVTQTITSCQLKNLNYPTSGELIIINSDEELENYVECTDIVDYPEIDFSQHTLLLVNGLGYYIVDEITVTDFQQLAADYKLDITVQLGYFTMLEKWNSSFLVKKMNVESDVELNVTYKDY